MSYLFNLKAQGRLCGTCVEPISNAKVRLYRHRTGQNVAALAVADPKNTFALLSDRDVLEKQEYLLAEATTDANGEVSFVLNAKAYTGEALEIDVVCDRAPGQPDRAPRPAAVQFTLTTVQPTWRETPQGVISHSEQILAARAWCSVRARLGAWTICGRVLDCDTGKALGGLRVLAFDVDWIQDDPLGIGLTDSAGHFRVNYSRADFEKTPLSPFINVEHTPGPDVYFRVETSGNTVLLAEPRSRGRLPDRENVGHCCCVELCVKGARTLVASLNGPTGCTAEAPDPVAGVLTVTVTGTAEGTAFASYALTIQQTGGYPPITGVVSYPGGGALGTVPVSSGTLGTIDTTALSDGEYQITLTVNPNDGGANASSVITFSLLKAIVLISSVGGVAAFPTGLDETAELMSAGVPKAVGGSIGLRGAAYVYECPARKIARYEVRYARVSTPGGEPAQPPNGVAIPATWTSVIPPLPLVYDDPSKYTAWTRVGPNQNSPLLYAWSTCHVGAPAPGGTDYPVLSEQTWGSGSISGRYTFLLVAEDTAGGRYYNLRRVWLDNHSIKGKIVKLQRPGVVAGTWEDIPSCTDILMSWGKVRVVGLAWDALIDDAFPRVAPNDNFAVPGGGYSLTYQEQFAVNAVSIVALTPTRVPALPASGPITEPLDIDAGELAVWTLSGLDAGVGPAQENKLVRGQSCTFILQLYVTDTTVVSQGTTHYLYHPVPIKIVNDL